MAGYLGSVRHTVYGGVKAFGRIFAESLWLELREYGVPGMRVSEPADVARGGLAQLPNGPVYVAGGNADDVARRSDSDRAKVVLGTHRFMQRLLGRG